MNKGTALITGANRGIGFATAEAFLIKGYRVILGVRDAEKGKEAAKKLEQFGRVEVVTVDVSNLQSIKEAAEHINANYGDLGILINNAGIAGDRSKKAWEYSGEELLEVYKVDFLGAYELTRSLFSTLEKNNGKVINLIIPLEARDFFHPFAYQAGKAPLNVLIDNFAFEIEKNNMSIQMIGIKPGTVSTDLNDNKQGKYIKTPEEAAAIILSVAESEENLNGQIITDRNKIKKEQENKNGNIRL